MSNLRLGELLVRKGLITDDQLRMAYEEQKKDGSRLGSGLVRLGVLDEKTLTAFLAKQYGVPSVDLENMEVDKSVLGYISSEVAHKHQLVPLARAGNNLRIAMSDPSNLLAIDDIKFMTGFNIEVSVCSESDIKRALDRFYDPSSRFEEVLGNLQDIDLELLEESDDVDIQELKHASEDAPVVKLVNMILSDAIKKGASDIHLESYEKSFRVRFRIDGTLTEVMSPPMKLRNAIISRVKIMSEMDIAERRLPQDGRIKIKLPTGREMDFRVSSLPTLFGEKVVLRLLDKGSLQLDMTKLGYEDQPLAWFKEAINKPFGMILVTGPTGSGKTVSLYSALTELNKITENISTAEDPVEFNFAGINQLQVHEEIGLTFASALRSFLRQDPDIIMIGEMRDFETAEIAVKAALTGHLVLSTLHTNDAPSTVTRLLNMGIEPFLVATAVNLISAQRLARKVCPQCKEEVKVDKKVLLRAGAKEEELAEYKLFRGRGCPVCNNTGYKGRVGIFQVMPMFESIREMVLAGANATEIKRESMRHGVKTMRQSALTKMKEGLVCLEEVLRVTVGDD